MPTNPTQPGAATIAPGKTNLEVAAGQTVVLSPDSAQFKGAYQQVHPQNIEQVRQILGVTVPVKPAKPTMAPAVTAIATKAIDIKDLDSKDLKVLQRAHTQAYQVANEYVRQADVSRLAAWKPVLDRYLAVSKAVLNIVALQDIVVNNGATLQISKNTHAVYARNVIIHGNGRIVCHARCKFKLTTLQGVK